MCLQSTTTQCAVRLKPAEPIVARQQSNIKGSAHITASLDPNLMCAGQTARDSVPKRVCFCGDTQTDATFASSRLRKESCHCQKDRKSTRLNSSHLVISYAVFC